MKKCKTISILGILALSVLFGCNKESMAPTSPQITFARQAINDALKTQDESIRVEFEVAPDASDLQSEGFKILKKGNLVTVVGKDEAGAMYGGLDLAETIRSERVAGIKPKTQNPYMQMRGTKFNIPLDVRTPSYTDVSDAAQKNIAEMWNMDFWKEYIDALATYRYNYVSLWSMHPFPSLVKVPEYPEIALADVKRSKGPFEEYYSLEGVGWKGPVFEEDNLETLKTMTIEEKIEFWRKVMAYGKSRNVDFYIITWNIFDYGIDGKYGITDDSRNETTIDYFRQSVKQLILTYPDLAGIGVTTGENMRTEEDGKDKVRKINSEEKEEWMAKTYVAGTLDALKEQPERKIRFIHRQHQAGADMVLKKMNPLIDHPNVDFIFSFKYAQAHVYSATRQPFHERFVRDIQGKVKTIWTLRNDDNYMFRWAAPDFIREFVKNIPYDVSQGYYYGHDGFIMGREFTQLDHESPRQIEVVKHWLQYMLWGRFAYDPDYSNERIIALLNARYPEVDGAQLLDAWQKASMVYPRVTGFHWGALDFQWYIEGVRSASSYTKNKRIGAQLTSGFNDVETFINFPTHANAGVQSIKDYAAGKKTNLLSPLALADQIETDVDAAEKTVQTFGPVKNKELRLTLDDIRIINEMGRYYADKIRGATYVAMARASKTAEDKEKAVDALNDAVDHYKTYVDLVTANHINEIWFNRVGTLNFKEQIKDAEADIEIARQVVVD